MADTADRPIARLSAQRLWSWITGPSLEDTLKNNPAELLASELPRHLAVKQESGVLKIVPRGINPVPVAPSFKRRAALWLRRFFRCRLDVAQMALPDGYVSVEKYRDADVQKAVMTGEIGTIQGPVRWHKLQRYYVDTADHGRVCVMAGSQDQAQRAVEEYFKAKDIVDDVESIKLP